MKENKNKLSFQLFHADMSLGICTEGFFIRADFLYIVGKASSL